MVNRMKKGFTILELLVTISILSLIILIAVPTVNNISSSVKKSHYQNMLKNIEIAASKYASDTKEEYVYVDTLIKEGYLKGDESDHLVNPIDSEVLNCYLVEMQKESDYYDAKFTQEKYLDENNNCDLNILKEKSSLIKINVINNGEVVEDLDNFLKGSITLEAISDDIDIDCNLNKCIWSSTSGLEESSNKINLDTVNRVINGTYIFQMTIYEEDTIKRLKASIDLKVDNENPKIDIEETKKSINEGKIKIIANDGIGSGIKEYYFGTSLDCSNVLWEESNIFPYEEEKNYSICVKDNVGNITREILEFEMSNNNENEVLYN